MAEPRRRRASTEEKLTRLLDATEEIILEEGYAAVSSRNVAAPAGLPSAFIAAAMQGIAFAIVADEAAGFDTAHADARAGMDRLVGLLEKRRTKRRRP